MLRVEFAMRLVTFDDFVPGVVRGEEVVDLTPAIGDIARLPWDERIPALVEDFAKLKPAIEKLAADGRGAPLASVKLRAPNPRPGKFICSAANYKADPAAEALAWDLYYKGSESIIGNGDTVVLPKAEATDFEAEAGIALVIGRTARDVSEGDALGCVFGYTGFIDVFGRGLGRPVSTYFGKSFDTFGPMGPCLVTADEIGDVYGLRVKLSVIGKVGLEYATGAMNHRVPAQIAAATAIMTLVPGDMIYCGSDPRGVAPLKDKDTLQLEITPGGIGRLEVQVSDPLGRTWSGG
jgi:2-keto-4-pentenoate hydratase/2-oxohepta-3-ene-1,7-dioic acid hydratase in catechol pathway